MSQQIRLNRQDAARLQALAEQILHHDGAESAAAERLLDIVSAALLTDEAPEHASLHSTVIFSSAGTAQTITLVEPSEVDPGAARISVLAPVGLALLGRKPDDESEVALPSGRTGKIRIVAVTQPATDPCVVP